MTKLSVAILTFQEEENIKECLESVKWADEIVLIDEKSTDKTVAIAKKYTDKIYLVDHGTKTGQTHDTAFHKHKQLTFEKCNGDWIFQLDADERLSLELAAEIKEVINNKNSDFDGFQVPRKNYIFDKWIQHAGWYPDYQVKLFKKDKGNYPTAISVHEQIKVDGKLGTLKGDLIHNHYKTISQFINRLNNYTTNDARFIIDKGEKVNWYDAIRFPADEFFKRFFFWEGYKDGLHGFILASFQALSRLVVFAKIWERQGFWQYGDEKFLNEFEEETKKLVKDYRYWLMVTAKKSHNFVKYLFLKCFPL